MHLEDRLLLGCKSKLHILGIHIPRCVLKARLSHALLVSTSRTKGECIQNCSSVSGTAYLLKDTAMEHLNVEYGYVHRYNCTPSSPYTWLKKYGCVGHAASHVHMPQRDSLHAITWCIMGRVNALVSKELPNASKKHK